MAPTSTPQNPVRLDPDGKDTGKAAKSVDPKSGDLNDPALWDPAQPTKTPARSASSGSNRSRPTQTSTPQADRPANLNQPEVIILDPSDNGSAVVTTVEPTPEELPHTGMADSWNIPSMLALLMGLLLVIIGVRRLRKNRR